MSSQDFQVRAYFQTNYFCLQLPPICPQRDVSFEDTNILKVQLKKDQIMKQLKFLFLLAVALMGISLTACGDDKDEPGGGGDIVGTWECDISRTLIDEMSDMYKSGDQLIQFRSDGTMVTVNAYVLTDAWAAITGEREEVEVEYGTYRISGDKLISSDGETVKFKLQGNKLTLTPTSGIILPFTFTRVSDSRINKYMN